MSFLPSYRPRSVGFQASHLARLMNQTFVEALAPLGLAPAQYLVLLELWQEEALTQRELVTRLDVEQATMGNTLARMERDGLIRRQPHPLDQRAQTVHLTERSAALQQPAMEAALSVNQLATERLSEAEIALLLTLIGRIIGTLKQRRERPPR